jgi:hypothetical protein
MRKPIITIVFTLILRSILSQPVQAQVGKKSSSAAPPTGLNTFNPNKWLGTWERRIWQEEATFDIKNISGNSFAFDFNARNAAPSWEAKGRAYLQDNHTAVFSSPIYSGCKLTIHLVSDSVIQIEGSKCEAYGGKNVSYTGRFVNNKYLPKVKQTTMFTLHVFNKQQDDAFRALVGKFYFDFVNFTQHIHEEKAPKPGMRVFSSTPNGLQGIDEYIIMVDNSNHIWTAVLDGGLNVFYFTNTADKKTLPAPIKQWLSHLPKKYPIIYQNK